MKSKLNYVTEVICSILMRLSLYFDSDEKLQNHLQLFNAMNSQSTCRIFFLDDDIKRIFLLKIRPFEKKDIDHIKYENNLKAYTNLFQNDSRFFSCTDSENKGFVKVYILRYGTVFEIEFYSYCTQYDPSRIETIDLDVYLYDSNIEDHVREHRGDNTDEITFINRIFVLVQEPTYHRAACKIHIPNDFYQPLEIELVDVLDCSVNKRSTWRSISIATLLIYVQRFNITKLHASCFAVSILPSLSDPDLTCLIDVIELKFENFDMTFNQILQEYFQRISFDYQRNALIQKYETLLSSIGILEPEIVVDRNEVSLYSFKRTTHSDNIENHHNDSIKSDDTLEYDGHNKKHMSKPFKNARQVAYQNNKEVKEGRFHKRFTILETIEEVDETSLISKDSEDHSNFEDTSTESLFENDDNITPKISKVIVCDTSSSWLKEKCLDNQIEIQLDQNNTCDIRDGSIIYDQQEMKTPVFLKFNRFITKYKRISDYGYLYMYSRQIFNLKGDRLKVYETNKYISVMHNNGNCKKHVLRYIRGQCIEDLHIFVIYMQRNYRFSTSTIKILLVQICQKFYFLV